LSSLAVVGVQEPIPHQVVQVVAVPVVFVLEQVLALRLELLTPSL
jgi:hypothetical protein